MIVIDNILVSDDVIEKKFICDLDRCKGGCCEEGDAGAPLEDKELDIIINLFDKVRPYLTSEALSEIEKKGKYVYHKEFGWVTPTLGNDKELCVYAYRETNGVIKCAFEQAFNDGHISWKKPVSCHLFPIIANNGKQGKYPRVNYEPREKLCNPACVLGQKMKVSVYVFLKEAIVRKFGTEFYNALDKAAKFQEKQKTK